MASGDDPLADAQNMLGYQGLFGPNPYLEFTGQIPLAGYAGAPTSAVTGQPIQSFQDAQTAHDAWQPPATPGTTLNSANPFANVNIPQGQNTAVAEPFGGLNRQQWDALTPQQRAPAQAAMGEYQAGVAMTPSGNNFVASGSNPSGNNPQASAGMAWQGKGYQDWNQMISGAGQQAPAPAPTNPVDMRQAYLQALANPGKIPSYGAVMQPGASATGAPQPSVLKAFLASHPEGGAQIPGGYGNQTFFSTLNNLQAAKT